MEIIRQHTKRFKAPSRLTKKVMKRKLSPIERLEKPTARMKINFVKENCEMADKV